jgi:hypothetical protein
MTTPIDPGAGTSKPTADQTQLSLLGIQTEFHKFSALINAKLDGLDAKMPVADPVADFTPKRVPKPVTLTNGNQQQHDFIEDVQHNLNAADSAIRAKKLEPALEFIAQGNLLLDKRKKLVKYANSTSWMAANEYAGPELADDSDDEKKMRRCENAADRKMRAKGNRARGRGSSRYGGNYQRDQNGSSERQYFQRNRGFNERRGGRSGACHECGRFGHWANECRNRRSSTTGNGYDTKNKR